MQLALTPEVLFPLGACAVVALAVIAVVVVLVRGRRTAADDALVPTAADWTGEAATADPTPSPTVTVPALPQRLTVAEAIAVRDADTAPLPVSSLAFLGARPATAVPVPTGPLPRVPGPADTGSGPEEPAGPGSAAADPVPSEAAETAPRTPEPVAAEAAGGPEPTGGPEPVEAAAVPAGSGAAGEAEQPEPAPGAAPEAEPSTSPAPRAASRVAVESGSGLTVAAAVAHALAVRAAAGREPGAPAPVSSLPVSSLPVPSLPVPSRTADARDRLLAVLLADPARAVGAAEELATCRGQLSDVLARLASSGLSTDQLARLSGFSVEQVTALLAQQPASR